MIRVAIKALCVGAILLGGALTPGAPLAVAQSPCVPVTVGVDTSYATDAWGPFLGTAVGQGFLARDTLISSITVWRPAGYLSSVGAHLFTVGFYDSIPYPSVPYPNVHNMILDGPTIRVYDSDPPGQPIEMRWVFDPPLVLPRPAYYAMFFQAEDCWQGEPWRLLVDGHNHYPDGIYWITGRVTDTCYLRGAAGGGDNDDLIFRIEFCRTASTPVRRTSWGELKVIYR